MMVQRPIWMKKPSPLLTTVKGIVLVLTCAVVLVPFLAILSTSVASKQALNEAGGMLLLPPSDPTLDAYQSVLAGGVVTQSLLISLFITIVGTAISLAATTGLAYSLSRQGSMMHRPILMLVLGTLMFSAGIIPTFLVVKNLGLVDTIWAQILPIAINGFNVVVMRAFFMELPDELFESARIDGASEIGILWRIVLPLSKAVMAVIGLFYAVGYWNNYFNALIYVTNNPDLNPLQSILRTYVVNQNALGSDQLATGAEALPPQQSMQMAILVISIVPIIIVYPFLQRHFAKGVLVGAVKG